jgi:hypothetical protein
MCKDPKIYPPSIFLQNLMCVRKYRSKSQEKSMENRNKEIQYRKGEKGTLKWAGKVGSKFTDMPS